MQRLHCAGLQEIQALSLFPKRIAVPQAPFLIFETSLTVLYFIFAKAPLPFSSVTLTCMHLSPATAFLPDILNLQHL